MLNRNRNIAAREHRLFGLDGVSAELDWFGMQPGVHANGVARARFDAEATEDAAQLVDDESNWVALAPASRIALSVFARLDEDALRWACR
jgi:hypothetical protein